SIHLLIAGDGELAGEVRAEIGRLGLSDRVTMLGAIAQAELAPLHRISSAFVLSSVYEGLPLVALEALASGTPVVTTQSGETPKLLLSGSGIVCGERTPTSLADALRKILQHPDDYPIDSCVQSAKPYAASNVIRDVYNAMLHRWEKKGVRA
ncbi:glycosyltransferase family 4 protein, partial [Aetokthonos hydrillicola]